MVDAAICFYDMRISAMPAQGFLRIVVGGELMARAVASAIESQQVELMPDMPL